MRLSIEFDIVKQIVDYIRNIGNKVNEIEFRVGTMKQSKFIPGVTRNQYELLLSYLLKTNANVVEEESTVYIDSDTRLIKMANKEIIQTKRKDFTLDIHFSNVAVRFCSSREQKLDKIPSNFRPSMSRRRIRKIFHYDHYTIELTTVQQDNNDQIYEVEIEFDTATLLQRQIDNKMIIGPLKDVLEAIFPHRWYLIQLNEYLSIVDEFNKLFHTYMDKTKRYPMTSIFRYENNPRNIKRSDIMEMKHYSVTNKLNGIGYFLFISNGIYLVNKTNIDILVRKIESKNSKKSLLHGEWFENKFYVFDTLFFEDSDVTLKNHMERLDYSKQLLPKLNKWLEGVCVVENKNFIYTTNLSEDTQTIMKYMYNEFNDRVMEKNDGLVYTPIFEPYRNNKTLKYKFPSELTIDFALSFDFVSKQDNCGIYFTAMVSDTHLVPFVNNGGIMMVYLSQSNPLYKSLTIEKKTHVVECFYDTNQNIFIPQRLRDDKLYPNYINVAKDVFQDILNPIHLSDLVQLFKNQCGEDSTEPVDNDDIRDINITFRLDKMRKYHNLQKHKLISKYVHSKTVLDIGFGKGGDIHKYYESNVNFVWGIEPESENYTEAIKRIKTKSNTLKKSGITDFHKKIKIIPTKAQNTNELKSYIRNKVDVVVSFFSLTFFFEKEEEIENLVNTVSSFLKSGGYFIGTTMDGDRTYTFLEKTLTYQSDGISIDKLYDDSAKDELGMKIKIDIKNSIVKEQYEYLVFFDILVEKLNKKGIKLVETNFFDQDIDYKEYNIISKLFRTFVFIKS